MKAFQLIPAIAEYADFGALASELKLGPADLILTNEYIYNPTIASLNLGCHTCFQEKYGGGEPTDVMVDAILDDLRDKDYDRIVAVGGGTVIDIAKVLAVAPAGARTDDLYRDMAHLEAHRELVILPTTCGTGSEVTNISILNRTRLGSKTGLVSPAMFARQAVLVPELLSALPWGCSPQVPSTRWSMPWNRPFLQRPRPIRFFSVTGPWNSSCAAIRPYGTRAGKRAEGS